MPDWLPERLPEDIESERSLLATCCAPGMDRRAVEVFDSLEERDFVAPQHKALFNAARALLMRGDEVHALTLKAELEAMGLLGSVGGFAGLTELLAAEEVGRPEVLAKLLVKKRQGRDLIKLGARIVREVTDQQVDPVSLAQGGAQEALGIVDSAKALRRDIQSSADVLDEIIQEQHEGVVAGIPTGMARMDAILGGLHPGNLIVVAARPGQGKTALALQMAMGVAELHRQDVAFWSLEMSKKELVDRQVAQLGGASAGWARGKRLTDAELAAVMACRDQLKDIPFWLCDDAGTTPGALRLALMKRRAQGRPVKLLVVDYIQLMSSDDPRKAGKQNDAARVGDISRALKVIGKDFEIPVLLLSQLNRDIENRPDQTPRLSDLRDSGAIEQDADTVIFVNRPSVEGKAGPEGTVLIPKHRHGPPGSFSVRFDGARMRFYELSGETAPANASGGWD